MSKRIVFLWCRGPLAGLHQIQGTEDQAKTNLQVAELPTFVPNIDAEGGSASLISVKPRWFLYRQNTPKETGRLNEFHPSQV